MPNPGSSTTCASSLAADTPPITAIVRAEIQRIIQRALFHAVAAQGTHRLSFEDWSKARDLGIALPEGVRPTIARNFVIANIAAPSGYVETEETA
jgi:hypothetical protein